MSGDDHLLFLIITVLIASYKGRSIIGWGLFSLFFPWLTLIVVIFVRHKYRCRC